MADAAVTIDLHLGDDPDDIRRCDAWLRQANIAATFFIPTIMLRLGKFKRALAGLSDWRHELATHAHRHNDREIEALQSGKVKDLDFLSVSKACFEDFFGYSPISFRSPTCCKVNAHALDELCRLGYRTDTSVTPQRLGILGSYPFQNPYLWSRRHIHFIREGLLEIPTSSLLVPLISPTFQTFRHMGSLAFLSFFIFEARCFERVAINMMFHAEDFVPDGKMHVQPAKRLRDLIPKTPGGIEAKHWFRERRREKISALVYAILHRLSDFNFRTIRDISERYVRFSQAYRY